MWALECGLCVPALLARVHDLALQLAGGRAPSYSRRWHPHMGFPRRHKAWEKEKASTTAPKDKHRMEMRNEYVLTPRKQEILMLT